MKKIIIFILMMIFILISMSSCFSPAKSTLTYDEAESIVYDVMEEYGYRVESDEVDGSSYNTFTETKKYNLMIDENYDIYLYLSESDKYTDYIFYNLKINKKSENEEKQEYILENNPVIINLVNSISQISYNAEKVLTIEKECVDEFNQKFDEKGYDAESVDNGYYHYLYPIKGYPCCEYMISTGRFDYKYNYVEQYIMFSGALK